MYREPNKRDLHFLEYHNFIYKTFEFLGRVNDISAYVNTEHEPLEKCRELITIPSCSGQGDDFLFIAKGGGVIFVDYALIKPYFLKDKRFKTDDEKVAKFAANSVFGVLARRANFIGYDTEKEFFKINGYGRIAAIVDTFSFTLNQ